MGTKNMEITSSIKMDDVKRKLIAMGAKYGLFIGFFSFEIAIAQIPEQGIFFKEETIKLIFNHRTGENLSVWDFLNLDDEEFEKLAEEAIIRFILEEGT
jgi:hypothetical protein